MKDMDFTKLSRIAIIIAVCIILIADIPAVISETEGDTISEQIYLLSKEYPLIPLLVGIVLGHFYWPLTSKSNDHLELK